jgi:uncharacterized membrane protein YiaA
MGAGRVGFLVGLYRADMVLNEKGYYFTVLMVGLFAVISVQKSVRDRLKEFREEGLRLTYLMDPIILYTLSSRSATANAHPLNKA